MPVTDTTVIIIGAGLTGICASRYLSRSGIAHLLLEKSSRVGGMWRRLDWPGIRCDTEIVNYSYSFNPLLSKRKLLPGAQIAAYLDTTATRFDVIQRVRFGTQVISASYSSEDHHWHLVTSRGNFRARFLVNANGYFEDRPYLPTIAARERYRGEARHLFELDRHADFTGKSVILVGSGASAISAAPALARRCRHLTLLQRSPSYIYEDDNRAGWLIASVQRLHRAGLRFPLRMVNWLLQCRSDLVFVGFRKLPWLGRWFFRRHWRGSIDRDRYATHFQPRYAPWQQRIPVALGFKRLLDRTNFSMQTGEIAAFQRDGLELADGRRIDADAIVFATGFELNFFRFALTIDGKPVDTRGINFYKSMMMGGLPNYFQPFGAPHTSFTRRVETICALIARIIIYMQREGFDSVSIARREVPKRPRITPGYVLRKLDSLPAFHGSFELPTLDNLLCYRFRPREYRFAAGAAHPPAADGIAGLLESNRRVLQPQQQVVGEAAANDDFETVAAGKR